MRLCWAEKDAMIWTDNILMEHIKAWKWSRRSACLWSPHSLTLNSQGGAQCSHSEIGWMTDAPSLVLSHPLLSVSLTLMNSNNPPLPIQLSFSFPLFLSPQNISSLGKFLVICSHRLNEFNWECIGPDAHPLREKSSALAYICRAAPCSSIVPSASFTNRSSERKCERKLSRPGGGTPWCEKSCVVSVQLCFLELLKAVRKYIFLLEDSPVDRWSGIMGVMSLLLLMVIGWCGGAPPVREVYRMPQSALKGRPGICFGCFSTFSEERYKSVTRAAPFQSN